MEKDTIYRYVGTNGTIETGVHLPGVTAMKMYRLYADYGKRVTKDGKEYYTVSPLVPEDELKGNDHPVLLSKSSSVTNSVSIRHPPFLFLISL